MKKKTYLNIIVESNFANSYQKKTALEALTLAVLAWQEYFLKSNKKNKIEVSFYDKK